MAISAPRIAAFLVLVLPTAAVLNLRSAQTENACVAADLKHRIALQNKLAGSCEDMCKEIGSYPDCKCPDFVKPDETPDVTTWDELYGYMDTLVEKSISHLKGWKEQAGMPNKFAPNVSLAQLSQEACEAEDLKHRIALQNKIAGSCEDMCKEIGSYPDCKCPDFVKPDE